MNIEPAKPLPVLLLDVDTEDEKWLDKHRNLLKHLGRIESIEIESDESAIPESATALVGDMRLLIPLGAFIDRDAEIARLEKEISRYAGEINRARGKLQNSGFVAKAPAEVVDREKQRLAESETAHASLVEQLDRISVAE